MAELIQTGLQRRVDVLRQDLAQRETAVLAQNCGADLVDGGLTLAVWETAVLVTTPDFIAHNPETNKILDPMTQALIAYYLWTSDGTPPAGKWIAFTELPDGRFSTIIQNSVRRQHQPSPSYRCLRYNWQHYLPPPAHYIKLK
jgi:hypothetical protein